jgi:hypothetical protein
MEGTTFQTFLERLRWVGYIECIVQKRSALIVIIGKPERKKSLVKPNRTRVYKIEIVLTGM